MLPEEAYKMNMGPSHLATQELTREYQLRIRKDVNSRAADTVLGADAAMFLAADVLVFPLELEPAQGVVEERDPPGVEVLVTAVALGAGELTAMDVPVAERACLDRVVLGLRAGG